MTAERTRSKKVVKYTQKNGRPLLLRGNPTFQNKNSLVGQGNSRGFIRVHAGAAQGCSRKRHNPHGIDHIRPHIKTWGIGKLSAFTHEDQESQERRSATISEELTGIQEQEENLVKRVAELRSKVDALSRTDELSQLLQQEAALVEDMERMAFAWSRVALARSILETAKRTFELERQPEVIRLASSIFTRITGQRWRGINASLEDASLAILPAQGEPIAPENLSRGAREQAYLALRLAYIKNHGRWRQTHTPSGSAPDPRSGCQPKPYREFPEYESCVTSTHSVKKYLQPVLELCSD